MKYVFLFSSNAGKYGPEKTPYLDTFHAVPVYLVDELVLVFFSPLMIGLMVDLLTIFYICYYCFSSMGSWCYSVKWVWDSRTKLCCIAFRK